MISYSFVFFDVYFLMKKALYRSIFFDVYFFGIIQKKLLKKLVFDKKKLVFDKKVNCILKILSPICAS